MRREFRRKEFVLLWVRRDKEGDSSAWTSRSRSNLTGRNKDRAGGGKPFKRQRERRRTRLREQIIHTLRNRKRETTGCWTACTSVRRLSRETPSVRRVTFSRRPPTSLSLYGGQGDRQRTKKRARGLTVRVLIQTSSWLYTCRDREIFRVRAQEKERRASQRTRVDV